MSEQSNSALRKFAVQQPVDAAHALIEARDLILKMARYMRWTFPGQEEGCDSHTRSQLWTEAQAWEGSFTQPVENLQMIGNQPERSDKSLGTDTTIESTKIDRLLEAYAKSIAVYYAAEKAFQADPTPETAHAYDIAAHRFSTLRAEHQRGDQLGDAIVGTEDDESVGR